MANYKITLLVNGGNIKTVQNLVKKTFGQDISAQVEKQERVVSRADRLSEAESTIEDVKSTVEELKDEMQEWYDGIPENLQQGSKADEVQEAIDALESLSSELDSLDFSSVNFPGMF